MVSVHSSHTCFFDVRTRSVLTDKFTSEDDDMSDKLRSRERYGETFWRAHHEAWRHSELNQREYCEAQGIPLKAFGNWRAKFKAEPQPPSPKLLYRRRNLSHTLGHSLSHRLSHMTYGSPVSGPIVPPAREGHRRRFTGMWIGGGAREGGENFAS